MFNLSDFFERFPKTRDIDNTLFKLLAVKFAFKGEKDTITLKTSQLDTLCNHAFNLIHEHRQTHLFADYLSHEAHI